MDELVKLGQLASSITLTGFLLIVVYSYFSGRVPTPGELKRLEESERRAWEQTEQARAALAANNQVLERLTDAMGQLRTSVDAFTRARAGGSNGDD